MTTDLDRLAVEADRLAKVYLRIKLLAQVHGVAFDAAGWEAATKGVVTVADWMTIREAIRAS